MKQCGSAFGELRLRPPMPVSLRGGDAGPVLSQLVGAAQEPEPHIPLTPSLKVGVRLSLLCCRSLHCRVLGYDIRSQRSCSALDSGRDRMQSVHILLGGVVLATEVALLVLRGVLKLAQRYQKGNNRKQARRGKEGS